MNPWMFCNAQAAKKEKKLLLLPSPYGKGTSIGICRKSRFNVTCKKQNNVRK